MKRRFDSALAVGLIVFVGVVAYWNSFEGAFLYDDWLSIADNPHIRKLWPLQDSTSVPLWSTGATVDGRPLLSFTFALNHAIFGPAPWGYHLVNLLVHLASGLLLFGCIRRTLVLPRFRERYTRNANAVALAVALIWLVHPLHTESVTYIVQRAESLMGMLYLLTLYCAIRGFAYAQRAEPAQARRAPKRSGDRRASAGSGQAWYVAAVVACALGMGVKQTMVTAPVLIMLYDAMFVSGSLRASWSKRRRWYAALCSTWLIVFGILAATWREATVDFVNISPVSYLLTQPLVILTYLKLSFWPAPLVLSYGWPLEEQWHRIAFPGLVILGLLALMIRGVLRRKGYGFLLAWFFLILAPTSSISPLRQAIFEHRMYLSLAAVIVGVVLGVERVMRSRFAQAKHRARLHAVLVVVVVTVMAALTHDRNKDYHSELGMWQSIVAGRPDNDIAHYNLGGYLMREGRAAEALQYYGEALRIDPKSAETHANLSAALQSVGRSEDALTHCREALAIDPDHAVAHNNMGVALHALGRPNDAIAAYEDALRSRPHYAEARINLGFALYGLGRYEDAIKQFKLALEVDSSHAEAYNKWGNALLKLGRPADALVCYLDALTYQPGHAMAHYNTGRALQALQRPEEAIAAYRAALAIKPSLSEAHLNLGNVLAALRRRSEAIACYRKALQYRPNDAVIHYNWALALEGLGQTIEAARHYRETLRLRPDLEQAREGLRRCGAGE